MNFKSVAADAIDKEKDELILLSNEIWQHPEICFQEHHAVATLTDFLRKRDVSLLLLNIVDWKLRSRLKLVIRKKEPMFV